MQPIKLSIEGNYWDSQIYKNKLYLWTFENELIIIDWEKFISWFSKQNSGKAFAIYCAFFRSDILYRNFIPILFKDKYVEKRIKKNLSEISGMDYSISKNDLLRFLIKRINNPFNELIADTEIYNNKIYAITDDGLSYIQIHDSVREPIEIKKIKIWDHALFSLKASQYGNIALSAGDDGLYEHSVYPLEEYSDDRIKKVEKEIFLINEGHSLFTDWIYSSIYNSSDRGNSYLAKFDWDYKKIEQRDKQVRYFDKIIKETDIFKINDQNYLSWGSYDKIYKVSKNKIYILRYKSYKSLDFVGEEENRYGDMEIVRLRPWKGNVISAGTAFFGSIVECENALIILKSNNDRLTIRGDITGWRVFPRSKYYLNQLHVVKNNSLDIYSFNHDYFVDQKAKNYGIKFNQKYLKSLSD